MTRILFSGYYGLGNAGDEAVLSGLLGAIRRSGIQSQPAVLSADPALTERWHDVDAVPRMRPAVAAAIERCDLLVSGGGSLLQDVTSLASLAYYLAVIAMAKAAGKPVAIAAHGVGPLRRAVSRRGVGAVLERADLLTVRDPESGALLRTCGVGRPIHVTADPAFCLSVPRRPSAGERVVGLALRRWAGRDAAAWGSEVCRQLLRRGARPLLIPMQEPADRSLADEILARTLGVEVSPPPDRLEDVLAAIGRCDALIGMRLHALLLAASAGIPVVAWSYDPKVDALLHRLARADGLLPLEVPPAAAAAAALSAAPAKERVAYLRARAGRTGDLIADLVRRA